MAYRYGHPIRVTLAVNGQPVSFRWCDCYYPVSDVSGTWHLTDRWGEKPPNPVTAGYSLRRGATDRWY